MGVVYSVRLVRTVKAVRRCGELLKEIESKQGARSDLGDVSPRSEAAKKAGLSDDQRKTALRVVKAWPDAAAE